MTSWNRNAEWCVEAPAVSPADVNESSLISLPRICGAVAFRLMFIFVGECRGAEDANPNLRTCGSSEQCWSSGMPADEVHDACDGLHAFCLRGLSCLWLRLRQQRLTFQRPPIAI